MSRFGWETAVSFLVPPRCVILLLVWVEGLLLPPPPPPPPSKSAPSIASERSLAGPKYLCNEQGRAVTVWGMLLLALECLHLCKLHMFVSKLYSFPGTPHENSVFDAITSTESTGKYSQRQTHTISSPLSDRLALFHSRERGRRWSRRLMDMFVYLFVLDVINRSAG